MLDVKALINKLLEAVKVDFVVEEGTTSDGWTYRKWNSGIAECWRMIYAGSVAMTIVEGSGYYHALLSYNFPSGFFTATPVVTASESMTGALGGFSINIITNTLINGYWWATRSVTKACYLHVHAIGKWK